MIPVLPDAMNVLVIGPVASGKSWLLDQWQGNLKRLLWFDTTGEIDEDDERFKHVYDTEEMGFDHPWWKFWLPETDPNDHRLCYHPRNILRQFPSVLRTYWKLEIKRHLIIDECQEVSHLEVIDTALRFARKRLLGIVGATQRIVDVSTTYRANARMIVFFYTAEGNDYDTIKESWGKEIAEQVRQLRPLVYRDAEKKVLQKPQALVYMRGEGYKIYEL